MIGDWGGPGRPGEGSGRPVPPAMAPDLLPLTTGTPAVEITLATMNTSAEITGRLNARGSDAIIWPERGPYLRAVLA